MQFGVQFFPDVRPEEKSAEAYFQEALDLAEEADGLGFSHIRIVEHYFHYYGGYSPNPIVFLAAVYPAGSAKILCRRIEHAGLVLIRRADGLFGDGDRAGRRKDAAAARRLSPRVAGCRASRPGRGDDRLPPVLRAVRRAGPDLR